MSEITSVQVKADPQADGRKRVECVYAVQDNMGEEYAVTLGPVLLSGDTDPQEYADQYADTVLARELEQERARWMADVASGTNPFITRQLRHHDRPAMLHAILQFFLSQPQPLETLVMGAEMMTRVTDEELQALLNIDDEKLAEIRNWQTRLLTVGAELKSYAPLLPGVNGGG